MKYAIVLCDGMADYKNEVLGMRTPMEAAKKPNMDRLAANGTIGLVKTVADGLKPGSDVANLSVLGYDPAVYYAGRSPLEAASIGIDLKESDVAMRANLVTLSDEADYEEKTMVDYCADDIGTAEADILVKYLEEHLGNEEFALYTGVAYRHCLVWHNGTTDLDGLTPPHDITGKPVKEHLPSAEKAGKLLDLMKKSYTLLKDHPVNKARMEKGLRPANSIWLWGEGRKKPLTSFYDKFGLKGSMISAVDLLKGIGKLSEMRVVDVPGATGYIDTNFDGKANAAIEELKSGQDFVYVHVEAPDECGHRGEAENKVRAIELIDEKVLAPLLRYLEGTGEDYKVMVLPDHATPLSLRTHTSDPIPFMIFHKNGQKPSGVTCLSEEQAGKTGVFVEFGPSLIDRFIKE